MDLNCRWLPNLHGETCSYISMTGKKIPCNAWIRCATMQLSIARCFPKWCGCVMRGTQLMALGLEPSTRRWLLPWLALLGVCFALNWIGKAQLVITTGGRGYLWFADVRGIWSFGSQASISFYVVSAGSFCIWGCHDQLSHQCRPPAKLLCGVSFRKIWKPPASFTCYCKYS